MSYMPSSTVIKSTDLHAYEIKSTTGHMGGGSGSDRTFFGHVGSGQSNEQIALGHVGSGQGSEQIALGRVGGEGAGKRVEAGGMGNGERVEAPTSGGYALREAPALRLDGEQASLVRQGLIPGRTRDPLTITAERASPPVQTESNTSAARVERGSLLAGRERGVLVKEGEQVLARSEEAHDLTVRQERAVSVAGTAAEEHFVSGEAGTVATVGERGAVSSGEGYTWVAEVEQGEPADRLESTMSASAEAVSAEQGSMLRQAERAMQIEGEQAGMVRHEERPSTGMALGEEVEGAAMTLRAEEQGEGRLAGLAWEPEFRPGIFPEREEGDYPGTPPSGEPVSDPPMITGHVDADGNVILDPPSPASGGGSGSGGRNGSGGGGGGDGHGAGGSGGSGGHGNGAGENGGDAERGGGKPPIAELGGAPEKKEGVYVFVENLKLLQEEIKRQFATERERLRLRAQERRRLLREKKPTPQLLREMAEMSFWDADDAERIYKDFAEKIGLNYMEQAYWNITMSQDLNLDPSEKRDFNKLSELGSLTDKAMKNGKDVPTFLKNVIRPMEAETLAAFQDFLRLGEGMEGFGSIAAAIHEAGTRLGYLHEFGEQSRYALSTVGRNRWDHFKGYETAKQQGLKEMKIWSELGMKEAHELKIEGMKMLSEARQLEALKQAQRMQLLQLTVLTMSLGSSNVGGIASQAAASAGSATSIAMR